MCVCLRLGGAASELGLEPCDWSTLTGLGRGGQEQAGVCAKEQLAQVVIWGVWVRVGQLLDYALSCT